MILLNKKVHTIGEKVQIKQGHENSNSTKVQDLTFQPCFNRAKRDLKYHESLKFSTILKSALTIQSKTEKAIVHIYIIWASENLRFA